MNKRLRPLNHIIKEVRDHIEGSGLSQEAYGKKAKVSQATISRALKARGNRYRESEGLEKLCKHAKINMYESVKMRPEKNTDLMDALADVWDGSQEHGKRLARLIRSLRSI